VHVAQSVFHHIAPAGQLGLSTVWVNREDDRDLGEATVPIPNLDWLPETLDPLVPRLG
jgi:FMN phosphatase YigB (HAD superfamily)